MSNYQFFKTVPGTPFAEEVKTYLEKNQVWRDRMFDRVSDLLGVKVERMAFNKHDLQVVPEDFAHHPEVRQLFTKDGYLKKNRKKSKELNEQYRAILKEEGLDDYRDMRDIAFTYNVMRYGNMGNPDELSSFRTMDGDMYYKASFDLAERSKGSVEPITEIEYHERYTEELKKQEEEAAKDDIVT